MKQFWTIFKFELAGYFKNKIFIGVTVSMVAALVILIFIPNIVSLVKKTAVTMQRKRCKIRTMKTSPSC